MKLTWGQLKDLPVVSDTRWARVEGSPRARRADEALSAEVRDPYWLLARQWALGEFQGDDAASPVSVEVTTKTRPVVTPGVADGVSGLMEAQIEAEPFTPDLRLRVQAGLELKRLIDSDSYLAMLRDDAFQLPELPDPSAMPAPTGGLIADPASRAFSQVARGRVLDGFVVLLRHRENTVPASFDTPSLRQAFDRLNEWFARTYTVFPDGGKSNWVPSTLEYRKSVELGGEGPGGTLEVDDYRGGRLDWWNFDLEGGVDWSQQPLTTELTLPTTIDIPGTPLPRYWEMEDPRIDFGRVTAAKTDLARLILAEFALLYAEDWFSVPLSGARGSLLRVERLAITNTFGERFVVLPSGKGSDIPWDRWSTFHPSVSRASAGDSGSPEENERLILFAPATLSSTHGPAIEEVLFARDEAANLLWGIEIIASNQLGEPASVMDLWGSLLSEPPSLPEESGLYYSLMTNVPRNWIPFTPMRDAASTTGRAMALERIPFLRTLEDGTLVPVLPLGAIVGKETPPNSGRYRMAEEGVNRVAQRVVRRFERARDVDGRVHLWLANHRTPAQPQSQSGLRFDVLSEGGQEGA